MFVYLYRWEWNRAIVAGIIFLAAEVGLLGAALFSRLSKLGHRVDELGGRQADPSTSVCCTSCARTRLTR